MAVKVVLPTALRQFADNNDTIELDGDQVGEVLSQLVELFPKLKPHLLGDDGNLRSFVNLFVNDQNIRDLQQQDTTVKDGDELAIIPAVAGGINR